MLALPAPVTTPVLAATCRSEAEHDGRVAGGVGLVFAILDRRRFRSKKRRTVSVFTE